MWKTLLTLFALFYIVPLAFAQNVEIDATNLQEMSLIAQLGRGTAFQLAWKPDGEILAIAGSTGLWFYNASFEQVDYWSAAYSYVQKLEWSPAGDKIAILNNGALSIFDLHHNVVFELQTGIESFAWHPSDDSFAIAIKTGKIKILNLETETLLQSLDIMAEDLAWKPDGSALALVGKSIQVLSGETYEILLTITEKSPAWKVQWSKDGQYLSTWCFDEKSFYDFYGACVWDASTGAFSTSMELAQAVWTNDNHNPVYFGASPYADITGSFITIEETKNTSDIGYEQRIRAMVWNPKRKNLTALTLDGTLVEFTFPSLKIEYELPLHSKYISSLSISPDSQRLVTITSEQAGQIWDLQQLERGFIDQPISEFLRDSEVYILELRWYQSQLITIEAVLGYRYEVYNINLRNSHNGKFISSLFDFQIFNFSIMTQQCRSYPNWDYTRFACHIDGELRIYSFDFSQLFLAVPLASARNIAWSPDNSLLAVSRYDNTLGWLIEIRDASTGRLLYTASINNPATPVWNHDLSQMAIPVRIDAESVVQIVSTEDYHLIATIPANYAAWHPSADMLALSTDTSLIFWTSDAGIITTNLSIPQINNLSWAANGRFIATSSNDAVIRLWGIPSES